jgi:hypothetical protein
MFSEETVRLRKLLRRAVAQSLPGLSAVLAYSKLKAPSAPALTKSDLIPFCEAAEVPVDRLPQLLAPYGVTQEHITIKSWKDFYEDELCSTLPVVHSPISLQPGCTEILRRFAGSIRYRAGPCLADMWTFVRARNPGMCFPPQIRLSAFCHLVKELDLKFSVDELIDALLAFFGRRTSAIPFTKFALFMYTFD